MNSPYYATDNGEVAKNFLAEQVISVKGYIEQDGTINRKLEKSGDYPYRIKYDAVDTLAGASTRPHLSST